MIRFYVPFFLLIFSASVYADNLSDHQAVARAARDYIESQHNVSPELMKRGIHEKLTKRTFWVNKSGGEYVMESGYKDMIKLAETYNIKGDKFPATPRVDVKILDLDQRVASIKLTVDEWVDYMHLIKNAEGDWKIINVLWQYHDTARHSSKN